MEFTIEQHYDITWLVAALIIGLFFIAMEGYRKFKEWRARRKYQYTTRYSHMKVGQ